jgi:hypothetical protein
MLRRVFKSRIMVKARDSATPSRDEMNSSMVAASLEPELPTAFADASSKKTGPDPQNIGDLLQPADADAIGALLVFLHLLKRYADRIRCH